jgi:MFS transporter, YQGE family, putative transporter
MQKIESMDTVAFYAATGEQVQCWQYHNSLGEGHQHQVTTIDSVIPNLDVGSMEKAIELMIRRHESLRTFFRVIDGEVKQCVIPYNEKLFSPAHYDMSAFDDENKMIGAIGEIIDEQKLSLARLGEPPHLKCLIFRTPANSFYLCFLVHHIISDKWSGLVMYKELSSFYELFKKGQPVNIGPLKLQMRDYALWQRDWLREKGDLVRRYWRNKLGDLLDAGSPDEDLLEKLDNTPAGSYTTYIGLPAYKRLIKLSEKCRADLLAVISASLQLLFYGLMRKEKTLIGILFPSRQLHGTESLIGYMVGGAYFRRQVKPGMSIRDFIREGFRDASASASNLIFDHDQMQLDGRILRGNCDVFIDFVNNELVGNNPMQREDDREHISLGKPEYYALSYTVKEYRDGLSSCWKYNPAVHSPDRITEMAERHAATLQAMCRNPGMTIGELMDKLAKDDITTKTNKTATMENAPEMAISEKIPKIAIKGAMKISTNAICLLVISSLFILANGLSTAFVTVFLWKLSNNYVEIAMYNIWVYSFMLFGFIISGYLSRKSKISSCLRLGMILLIVYFALILKLNTRSEQFIFLLGLIYGTGYGLFYYSANTLLYYYTNEDNRSFYLGLNNAFAAVMGIIAPTISGLIIVSKVQFTGYYYVFGITLLLYITAGIFSYFLDEAVQKGKFRLKKILANKDPNWRYVLKSNFFLGFREGAIYFLIDILYFITFKNELSFGGFTTVISFIAVISAYLIGRYIRKEFNNRAIVIGGAVTLFATLVLVSFTSRDTVIAYGILTAVFNCVWLIPVTFILYQVADSTMGREESMGDYMIAKEVPTAIGRVLGILLFIGIQLSSWSKVAVRISLPILNSMVLIAFIFALSRIKKPGTLPVSKL